MTPSKPARGPVAAPSNPRPRLARCPRCYAGTDRYDLVCKCGQRVTLDTFIPAKPKDWRFAHVGVDPAKTGAERTVTS